MPVPTFTRLGPQPEYNDLVNKINTLVAELTNLMLNMDSINVTSLSAGTVIVYDLDGGPGTITLTKDGMIINNGTIDTFTIDINGNVTMTSALIRSVSSGERVAIDSTGFHSYDSSGVERITIGTTPALGAKALIGRDTSGAVQSAYTYNTETVDGASRTGQFMTAHGSYTLLSDDGHVRIQNSAGAGFRAVSGTPEVNDGFGWKTIATTGLAGTKVYYVSDTSGGATTRKLTFTNGILTSET